MHDGQIYFLKLFEMAVIAQNFLKINEYKKYACIEHQKLHLDIQVCLPIGVSAL